MNNCKIADLAKWVRDRRRRGKDHVERMDNGRLANIATTSKSKSKRSQERTVGSQPMPRINRGTLSNNRIKS